MASYGVWTDARSKPLSYCFALEEHGEEKVHSHVGREPSGEQFNALKLNPQGLPHNLSLIHISEPTRPY